MSNLIEQLNDIKEFNSWEEVIDRLNAFGYEVTSDDLVLIATCKNIVESDIKLDCNILDVPDIFHDHFINRICGEFLSLKLATNTLDIASLDISGTVSSMSIGGTSVSYSSGDSDSAKAKALVDGLKNSGKDLMSCLRKIRF